MITRMPRVFNYQTTMAPATESPTLEVSVIIQMYSVYAKKYANGFNVHSFVVVVIQSFLLDPYHSCTHILQGYSTDSVCVVCVCVCVWLSIAPATVK